MIILSNFIAFFLFLENIKIFIYTIYYFKYKVILMETYFSVGEISKLTSIPIKILRHYDKMGLLNLFILINKIIKGIIL